MKLIIREYLSSLKERGELDSVLPDLLSQLGLNVYSRPARGTRQDGVDVAAVGSLDGGPEKVYLFSIKAGDLTRGGWDGNSEQSLRPSLNEIIDAYIPHRLPAEHRGKDIVICIALAEMSENQFARSLQALLGKIQRATSHLRSGTATSSLHVLSPAFYRRIYFPIMRVPIFENLSRCSMSRMFRIAISGSLSSCYRRFTN